MSSTLLCNGLDISATDRREGVVVRGCRSEALQQRTGHRGVDLQRDPPQIEAVDDASANAEPRVVPRRGVDAGGGEPLEIVTHQVALAASTAPGGKRGRDGVADSE